MSTALNILLFARTGVVQGLATLSRSRIYPAKGRHSETRYDTYLGCNSSNQKNESGLWPPYSSWHIVPFSLQWFSNPVTLSGAVPLR
jgi:hypothetical protein